MYNVLIKLNNININIIYIIITINKKDCLGVCHFIPPTSKHLFVYIGPNNHDFMGLRSDQNLSPYHIKKIVIH